MSFYHMTFYHKLKCRPLISFPQILSCQSRNFHDSPNSVKNIRKIWLLTIKISYQDNLFVGNVNHLLKIYQKFHKTIPFAFGTSSRKIFMIDAMFVKRSFSDFSIRKNKYFKRICKLVSSRSNLYYFGIPKIQRWRCKMIVHDFHFSKYQTKFSKILVVFLEKSKSSWNLHHLTTVTKHHSYYCATSSLFHRV